MINSNNATFRFIVKKGRDNHLSERNENTEFVA